MRISRSRPYVSSGRATQLTSTPKHRWSSCIATWRRLHTQRRKRSRRSLGTASILKGSRVVFNVGGNRYRVIMAINYQRQLGFIRFVGTHAQYDQINAETV